MTHAVSNRPVLLNRKQAAELMGINPQTLAVWAVTGRYKLPVIRVGRRCMYAMDDILKFLSSRRDDHGADSAE